ncbi:hypothetical protein [Flaviflexus huanghaiensis]|uniref:hypothetical protein n=1 Tax=Flaviflexus huanghaiensis TaxID=1111473 RepID=UPI0015FDF49A|nr:hypothetical protein [Flaviflexus huanghaiensis]
MIVAQIALPASPVPSRAMTELRRIVEQNVMEIDGDAETVYSPEMFTRHYRSQHTWKIIHLLAIDGELGERMESSYGLPLLAGSSDGVALWGHDPAVPISLTPEAPWHGDVVGMASVRVPLRETLDSAHVDINAALGREDAYGPLWEAARAICVAENRTKITAYEDHPFGLELRAPSSELTLARTRYSDFLEGAGFVLTQTETCSRLPLPVDDTVAATLTAEALEKADGYRTVSWAGPTPEEYRHDLVTLISAFQLDMPTAGIVQSEINFDVDRLVEGDRRLKALGITSLMTVAQHIDTGHLVAHTRLDLLPDSRAVIQEDTLVLNEHRGHRLGLLIKMENLRQLKMLAPEKTFIQTWNAGENAWMWSINERMGFRPHSYAGQWQKDISAG